MPTSSVMDFTLHQIDDKNVIFNFFQTHQPSLHLYEIGDLDDFFFPFTTWYALISKPSSEQAINNDSQLKINAEDIKFIVLLYQSPDCTVVLAFAREDDEHDEHNNEIFYGQKAMQLLQPFLPTSFYSQLTPGLLTSLVQGGSRSYRIEPHGNFLKMAIPDSNASEVRGKLIQAQEQWYSHSNGPVASKLEAPDLEAILTFYKEAYPGNWFDPRMLETGQYYGIWQMSQVESQSTKEDTNHKQSSRTLCAVAGIHVYSATRKVAALGNITTHPLYRKQGYARIAITALVLSLFDGGVERIGLNVKADNVQAISLYESLGFVKIGRYEENMIYQN